MDNKGGGFSFEILHWRKKLKNAMQLLSLSPSCKSNFSSIEPTSWRTTLSDVRSFVVRYFRVKHDDSLQCHNARTETICPADVHLNRELPPRYKDKNDLVLCNAQTSAARSFCCTSTSKLALLPRQHQAETNIGVRTSVSLQCSCVGGCGWF
jgi:hypothetical protein